MSDRFEGVPLIGSGSQQEKTIEVCRSFSYRLNTGNYEHVDFFASRKIQCAESAASWVSQQIYEECVEEVRGAIKQFKEEQRRRSAQREQERVA